MNVLIADDEMDMLKILSTYFKQAGFETFEALDGEEALRLFDTHKIDLAVLDWMMPKVNGLEVCEYIKSCNQTKVLILTAKGEFDDELNALNVGADEYIKKPFDPRVLLLRAKKLLDIQKELSAKYIRLIPDEKKAYKGESSLNLTKIEYDLLLTFMNNQGVILSREKLIDLVWGFDYEGDPRTVDTHIRRLRSKLGEDMIKTYRGLGYSLEGENH
ncbi:MAG: response regulator transcription factor [Turicibacter sp.]